MTQNSASCNSVPLSKTPPKAISTSKDAYNWEAETADACGRAWARQPLEGVFDLAIMPHNSVHVTCIWGIARIAHELLSGPTRAEIWQ